MTTPIRGLGASPFGVAAYGFGTPAVAPIPGGGIYLDTFGTQHGGRELSLTQGMVGQYVYNDFGRAAGMVDVHQLVILATKTALGSSASQTLGNRFSEVRYVGGDFIQKQTARVTEAYAELVAAGFIRVDSIEVEGGNGMPARTLVKMTDLTTNQQLPAQII
jgi:hypothetical protein